MNQIIKNPRLLIGINDERGAPATEADDEPSDAPTHSAPRTSATHAEAQPQRLLVEARYSPEPRRDTIPYFVQIPEYAKARNP